MLNTPSGFILHERGDQHYWSGQGLLSIKSFRGGEALYDVGTGRFAVGEGSCLVLNHGQPYTITIDTERPLESFCIFFPQGFAADVLRSMTAGCGDLLESVELRAAGEVEFVERTYRHDAFAMPALERLREGLPERRGDQLWLQERLHGVMEGMLRLHGMSYRDMQALDAVRPGTRLELYRRLHRARDYMAASYAERLSLQEIASAACLSPNHLLRTFRQLFGTTPYQYLTSVRLERAAELLVRTDLPVADIVSRVGFESPSSFTTLFRNHAGLPPDAYRRAKR